MRDPRLIEFARANRREMTEPEKKLWYQLRAKRFNNIKFRRQNIVGRYIADFYVRDAMMITEIDGDSHAFQADYDRVRQEYMEGLGFTVLRFTNTDVIRNMEGVLTVIANAVPPPLLPQLRCSLLSPEGERAV